jgi:hypothetical protein
MTLADALKHPWVTGETASTEENAKMVDTLKEVSI